jgi:hypothetical protein
MTFTVVTKNELLRNGHASGTYDTVEAAKAAAEKLAARSRSFCTFEVWEGTPRNLIGPVPKLHFRGQH